MAIDAIRMSEKGEDRRKNHLVQEFSVMGQAPQQSLSSTRSALLCSPLFWEREKARLVLLLLYLWLTLKQCSFLLQFISWPSLTIDCLSRLLLKQGRYFLHKVLLPNCVSSLGFLSFLQCLQRKTERQTLTKYLKDQSQVRWITAPELKEWRWRRSTDITAYRDVLWEEQGGFSSKRRCSFFFWPIESGKK